MLYVAAFYILTSLWIVGLVVNAIYIAEKERKRKNDK